MKNLKYVLFEYKKDFPIVEISDRLDILEIIQQGTTDRILAIMKIMDYLDMIKEIVGRE